MQMHVRFVLNFIHIPSLSSTLCGQIDYLAQGGVVYIFYIIDFSVNFLQSTWIRPQFFFQTRILVVTSLVNHQPVNIII